MLIYFLLILFFSGVVSIDVELSSIDINQCDAQDSSLTDGGGKNGNSDRTISTDSVKLVDFLGTHKCKKSTQVRLNTISNCLFRCQGLDRHKRVELCTRAASAKIFAACRRVFRRRWRSLF